MAHRTAKRLDLPWPESAPAPKIDPAECAAHFGLGTAAWKHVCYFAQWFYEHTAPLRLDSTERQAKRVRYHAGLRLLESGNDADSLALPGIGLRPVRLRITP